MPIEQEPFRKYNLEEDGKKKQDAFTVWLSEDERGLLEKAKKVLEQKKDSTALKSLAWIGAKTLGEDKIAYILKTVYENKRKNKRLNIVDFE